jgi:uncharacterized cupin superfamily protein
MTFNVYADEWENERDRPGFRWRHRRVGGEKLAFGLYELPPGERTFPYHFHYGNEEWLIVLVGTSTLRTTEGERELTAGDAVCFPTGPAGAHQVINRSDQPARVLILSSLVEPSISMYPDSDKVGLRPGVEEDTLNFQRETAVDYWEGERDSSG